MPNYPESAKMKLLVTIDAWTLKFINLAHAAVEHDLSVQEAALRADPFSEKAKNAGIETLSFFVDAMAPLSELLVSNRSTIPAARLNHFQLIALKTIHMAPIISSAFVTALRERLIGKDADPQAIQHAGFFGSLPHVASKFSDKGRGDLAAILTLVQNS
jgi:hypothetical protein